MPKNRREFPATRRHGVKHQGTAYSRGEVSHGGNGETFLPHKLAVLSPKNRLNGEEEWKAGQVYLEATRDPVSKRDRRVYNAHVYAKARNIGASIMHASIYPELTGRAYAYLHTYTRARLRLGQSVS